MSVEQSAINVESVKSVEEVSKKSKAHRSRRGGLKRQVKARRQAKNNATIIGVDEVSGGDQTKCSVQINVGISMEENVSIKNQEDGRISINKKKVHRSRRGGVKRKAAAKRRATTNGSQTDLIGGDKIMMADCEHKTDDGNLFDVEQNKSDSNLVSVGFRADCVDTIVYRIVVNDRMTENPSTIMPTLERKKKAHRSRRGGAKRTVAARRQAALTTHSTDERQHEVGEGGHFEHGSPVYDYEPEFDDGIPTEDGDTPKNGVTSGLALVFVVSSSLQETAEAHYEIHDKEIVPKLDVGLQNDIVMEKKNCLEDVGGSAEVGVYCLNDNVHRVIDDVIPTSIEYRCIIIDSDSIWDLCYTFHML